MPDEARTARLLHAGFVLTGVVTTLLGPLLPFLTTRWSLSDAQAGRLFAAQFFGSMAGVGLSGYLVPRAGFRRSVLAGYLAMAAGVAVLALAPWPALLAGVALYGLGLGLSIPATNLVIGEIAGPRRAASLNTLNLAWGIGAVLYPLLLALSHRAYRPAGILLGLAAAIAAMLALLAGAAFPAAAAPEAAAVPGEKRAWLVLLGVSFFLYVGTENAIAGWSAQYAQRLGAAPASWATTTAFFWGALILGRAVAPAVLRRIGETEVLLGSCVLAVAGTALEIWAHGFSGVLAGVTIAGLGLAASFPILIAMLSRHFGPAAPRAGSLLFALAGLGGATLPWLMGAVSSRGFGLRNAFLIPLVAAMALAALASGIRRMHHRAA